MFFKIDNKLVNTLSVGTFQTMQNYKEKGCLTRKAALITNAKRCYACKWLIVSWMQTPLPFTMPSPAPVRCSSNDFFFHSLINL